MEELELRDQINGTPVYSKKGTEPSNTTIEEDLINKWLFSMIRGDHVFLTEPNEEGKRYTAIKIEDLINKFSDFKKLWALRNER